MPLSSVGSIASLVMSGHASNDGKDPVLPSPRQNDSRAIAAADQSNQNGDNADGPDPKRVCSGIPPKMETSDGLAQPEPNDPGMGPGSLLDQNEGGATPTETNQDSTFNMVSQMQERMEQLSFELDTIQKQRKAEAQQALSVSRREEEYVRTTWETLARMQKRLEGASFIKNALKAFFTIAHTVPELQKIQDEAQLHHIIKKYRETVRNTDQGFNGTREDFVQACLQEFKAQQQSN